MQRRSGMKIMGQLIGLVCPLLPIMLVAVILGVAGYLCAIFLVILASNGLIQGGLTDLGKLAAILIAMAVLRGVLHYGEQYCNHFIAFKLLAIIRNKVFSALRRLCPAKLESRDKGNLVSMLTSDIELLEVFYAHTISPIVIAIVTSIIMVLFIGHYSITAALLAFIGYVTVGAVLPLLFGARGGETGMQFRNQFGDLNSFILDSLRGLDETIQYGTGEKRMKEMTERSEELGRIQKKLNRIEASQKSATNLMILLFSFAMMFLMLYLYMNGRGGVEALVAGTASMMSSFGPVVALSNLSNNLNQTLACGERVLSLLEESPQTEEVSGMEDVEFRGASVKDIDFTYEEERILKNYSIELPKGEIIGIHGASGSGKSTLLKLLMRFWDRQASNISISGKDICQLNTSNLRKMESYVTQETYLFHDSIRNNIAVGRPGASEEEIIEAAKKASVHEFIIKLPEGYETQVGELGDTLSGGERQRIGIARAFLHDAPFLLLDEPTSNLDSLNEGIILKSLNEVCEDKTVVLVSHRKSTMNIADTVYEMSNRRQPCTNMLK